MKSRVRDAVSTVVYVEIEVEHLPEDSSTTLTAEDRRRARQLSGLPGMTSAESMAYLGRVDEAKP